MNTSKIKSNLIAAIKNADNPLVLMEMSKLIDIDFPDDRVIKLNENQKNQLKLAISQIDNGQFLTHEEAKKQADEWLKD
jgi:hypothetical protein